MAKKLTSKKAKEILHDKSVHGHPLTDKQRKFFGAIAGGAPIRMQDGGQSISISDRYEKDRESSKKFLTDMANSPLFPIRYAEMTGKKWNEVNPREVEDYRKQVLDNLNTVNYMPLGEEPNKGFFYPEDDLSFTAGVYYANPPEEGKPGHSLWMNKNFYNPSTVTHELSHSTTRGHDAMRFNPKSFDYNPKLAGENESRYLGNEYLQDPTEIKARRDALGKYAMDQGIWDPTKELFNEEHYNKLNDLYKQSIEKLNRGEEVDNDIIHALSSFKDITEPYSKEEAIRLFNSFVKNEPTGKPTMAKHGGWLDKYQDGGQAGYTDIPFKYNSAWGGQFQMGGSLPGSVGFTYARTQGIPSEGPYAKKTMPSAQEGKNLPKVELNLPKYEEQPKGYFTGYGYGISPNPDVKVYGVGAYGEKQITPRLDILGNINTESVFYPGGSEMFRKPTYELGMRYKFDNGGSMSYYQHGLDWKPKSISRDGSVIKDDRGQWAHPGEITEIGSNRITMQGVPYPVLGISDQGDTQMMFPEQEYKFKGKKVTEIPMAQKGKTLPPVYVNDPNDPRLRLYNDSLQIYNYSKQMPSYRSKGSNVISKEEYNKKLKEELNLPHWRIDEDKLKKDNRSKKVGKFEDYVYDARDITDHDNEAHERNNPKPTKKHVEKKGKKTQLPGGRIREEDPNNRGYNIYDPKFGSFYSFNENNKPVFVANRNIRPESYTYTGYKTLQPYDNVSLSRTDVGFIDNKVKSKKTSAKSYQNYTYGLGKTENYKKPVQPVIYSKKNYNPNDPRLAELQRSAEEFASNVASQSDETTTPTTNIVTTSAITNTTNAPTTTQITTNAAPVSYEGDPVYGPSVTDGPFVIHGGGYLMGFKNPKGEITYIRPEDYDKYAVPDYGRKYIQEQTKPKKQKNGGWLDKYAEGGDLPETPDPNEFDTYEIQKGDTLFDLAQKLQVPAATLANTNALQNPNLIIQGKQLKVPKKFEKEFSFEEIPTTDNKKIVIDNFSKNYDYILEGDKLYYKIKGGKTWADISDNDKAKQNILGFIDNNNYWAGYSSGEKESFTGAGSNPKAKEQKTLNLPKDFPYDKSVPKSPWDEFFSYNNKIHQLLPEVKVVVPLTDEQKARNKKVLEYMDTWGVDRTTALKAVPLETHKDPSLLQRVVNGLEMGAYEIQKQTGIAADKMKHLIDDTVKEVEYKFNEGVENVEDLFKLGMNGIKRKLSTQFTGDTSDDVPVVSESERPSDVNSYYKNKSVGDVSAIIDAPGGTGRQFKQQTLPTSNIKFGFRNRGEYKDINTDGLEVTTFNPFTKDPRPDNTSVIAIDKDGNLHTGAYKDFKGKQGYLFSNTFKNNIIDFATKDGNFEYVSGEKSGNPKFKQPKVKVLDDKGKVVDGSLNVLIKDDSKKDFYGSVQGGRILFVDPETKEQYLVSGSLNHIAKEFKRIKGDKKYLEAYTLDNGTYSRGLSYKDKKLTPQRLKDYDNENTGGGNGLYIMEYKQPVSKYKEEYIQTPNVRTEKDQSYKKGHKLKNDIKNVVLHHTAYTNVETNERNVRDQYMTPGQNTSHVVIEEDGKRTVYASPEQVTFHAGYSKLGDKEDVNDFSIGVEFQGDTNRAPLTQAQIESFVEYYAPIAKKYGISLKDIVTHQMIRNNYINAHPDKKDVENKPDITQAEYKRVLKYMKDMGYK